MTLAQRFLFAGPFFVFAGQQFGQHLITSTRVDDLVLDNLHQHVCSRLEEVEIQERQLRKP